MARRFEIILTSFSNEFFIEKKGPQPPKSPVEEFNELKRRDDIVITKPDKDSGLGGGRHG